MEREKNRWVTIEVDKEGAGDRLDAHVPGKLGPGVSRSRFQALIKDGRVLLNGKIPKGSAKLAAGDVIEIHIPAPESPETRLVAQDIPIDVVYEDGRVLVVNKERGMVVHPALGHRRGTLANAILSHCPGLEGVGGELRPGIVHRLDKDTTGLIVVAKDEITLSGLQNQFKSTTAVREYLALCKGRLPFESGTVDAPIARDKRNRKRMKVVIGGRKAVTGYRVVTRFGDEYTLALAKLETGRTHQIRVHMAHLKRPVVGDPLYSRTKGELGLGGQALHAFRLGFVHPESGEFVEFFAPLPKDFRKALGILQRRFKEEAPVWVR